MNRTPYILLFVFGLGCDPFVTQFSEESEVSYFQSSAIVDNVYQGQEGEMKVVSWNIRFGSGRFPFFGDSCGEGVVADTETINSTMEKIADSLNRIDADIVLLQEVDISSKRSGYMNQIQYLLDNTYLNYGVYASVWKSDYVPTDGLGRVDMGNAILSKYELTDAKRIPLQLRTDQSSLVRYFYLRRNILQVTVPAFSMVQKKFHAVNIHATAFATDDTKQQHINKFADILNEINLNNEYFVGGGDLNSIPPSAATDYCANDACDGDTYHTSGIDPYHLEGSFFNNFPGEQELLTPLYSSYDSAIDFSLRNLPEHFTHAPSTSMLDEFSERRYDRKIDYLFTNLSWKQSSGITHQEAWELSDHMPVSGIINFQNEISARK